MPGPTCTECGKPATCFTYEVLVTWAAPVLPNGEVDYDKTKQLEGSDQDNGNGVYYCTQCYKTHVSDSPVVERLPIFDLWEKEKENDSG